MKAQNYKAIREAVFKFTLYLVASVVMITCCFFFFMKTSSVEVSEILEKAKNYDQIHSTQLDLKEKMDSLYYYASWLSTDSRINYRLLQNSLSEKKLQFSEVLSTLPEKDCLLYKKLISQVNIFFDTKDSLLMVTNELNSVREELKRCTDENREISRKLSIRGLTFEK